MRRLLFVGVVIGISLGTTLPIWTPIVTASATEPGLAGDSDEIPKALTRYKGRRIAQTMHYTGASWLMRDTRQREEDCEQLLRVLNAQPGQIICDMGCGNGFYTLHLARQVGQKGRVLAVDIQPEMLSLLNERTKQERLANIVPILGSAIDPHLPEGTIDLLLLVDVYHEFSHPVHMLKAMRKALKPHGRLVLVEFRLEDKHVPILVEHKMSKKQILKELPPLGFTLVEEYDKLPWQHVMFFEPGGKLNARDGVQDQPKTDADTSDSDASQSQDPQDVVDEPSPTEELELEPIPG